MLRRACVVSVCLLVAGVVLAAGQEDPFLWLEEVDGAEGPRLGQGAERADHQGARGGPSTSRSTSAPSRSSTPRSASRRRRCTAARLQLLAGRGARARHLAPHDARLVPDGRTRSGRPCSTSTRSPRRTASRGCSRERPACRPSTAAAWSRSRRGGGDAVGRARVRHRRPRASCRAASRCRRPSRSVAWKDENTLWVGTDFGDGLADHVRLPAHRQAVEARHAARRGAHGVRGPGRGRRVRRADDLHARGPLRPRRRALPAFFRHGDVPRPRRPPRQARPSPRTPSSTAIFKDHLLFSLRTDWTVGGQTYRAGLAARRSTSTTSCAAAATFDVALRAVGAGLARQASPRRATAS